MSLVTQAPNSPRCAATRRRYDLPPANTKLTYARRAGLWLSTEIAAELDALSVDVLTDRLRTKVANRMDMSALETVRQVETQERERLVAALGQIS